MYGQGYVGTSQDQQRIRRQEKQREDQKKKYEDLHKQSRDKVEAAGLKQFGSSTTETLESAFKNETVGLVTREEFIQKRTTLKERMEEELRAKQRAAEDAEFKTKERRRKEKAKLAMKSKLSFIGDDEEDDEEDCVKLEETPAVPLGAAASGAAAAAAAVTDDNEDGTSQAAKRPKFGKFGKDPSVATDFLPDRDREREEEELRTKLKQEWVSAQEAVRAEKLEVVYSYWDGQGHRRKLEVRKGDSISTFLKAARDQLASEFREMRAVSVDNLLYIKEDLILPHHHTFYDLIVNKARGKSGPLFSFTVHEDVRITNDASVEKADSHAGKVVERHWYDKNKHIFPASRWETYDPDKSYDKYTIFG